MVCICFSASCKHPWGWDLNSVAREPLLSRIFWEMGAKCALSFWRKGHSWLLPFKVTISRRLLGGSLIVFPPFCREWRAEQQGVCCHHEAAPDARLGEAQGHGLHTAHEGHVEVCPGDSMGLHSSQAAVAGLGRSTPIPWISPWAQQGGTRLWRAQAGCTRRVLSIQVRNPACCICLLLAPSYSSLSGTRKGLLLPPPAWCDVPCSRAGPQITFI